MLPGFSVEILPAVDSTNSELMRRARAGLADPVLLVAEHQTAGRGRLGRQWQDEGAPGNPDTLMFSLGLPLAPANWSGLSLAVGLCIAQRLHPDIRLKWPNDLWLQGRKLAGILIETVALSAANAPPDDSSARLCGLGRFVVIGVGINLKPRESAGLTTPPACLAELQPGLDAGKSLAQIAQALVATVQQFEQTGFAPFQHGFNARDALQGLAVNLSDGRHGVARGVDENGALLVATPAGVVKISSSEVSVRLDSGADVLG